MYLELNKYLKILFRESSRFSRTDLNNKVDNSRAGKYLFKLIFGSVSVGIILLLQKGFSGDFISFVSSVLSILVGLFITALIFSFDKFYEPTNEDTPNSRIKLWDIQAYNYAKKFAYITSNTIVLSIFTLVALVLSTLFTENFSINIFEYKVIDPHGDIWITTGRILLLSINIIQRFLVFYWLFKIVFNTLYTVSSMVQYMTTKMDQK